MKQPVPFLSFVICCLALFGPSPCGAAQPAAPAANVVVLKRLLLADTEAKAAAMKDPGKGSLIVFEDLPVFDTKEFRDKMTPFIGQPISNALIRKMAPVISTYVREKDLLTVNIAIPKQNADNGVLRLALRIGRYKDIVVRGNRWFSAKLIEESLGVKPGDEIRISKLDQAISWINTNPFRYTKAVINNRTGDPTEADLIIAVADTAPFRLVGTYDNSGVAVLGENRYTAAFQWGNVLGLGHQLTYQYSRSDIPRYFQAHSLDYRIPLPWHHVIQIDGAYATLAPTFGDGHFTERGSNIIGDVHYIIPVTKGEWSMEYSFGVDFKRTNNNLEFGGFSVFGTKVDTLQANLGATVVHHDSLGGWSVNLQANLSPGNWTPYQSEAVYQKVRTDSNPRYIYATLGIQRVTSLGGGWQDVFRFNGQTASTNLQGSEQMSIGGAETVRGYEERIYSADVGFYANNELQTPVITAKAPGLPAFMRTGGTIQVRGLAFVDCGDVKYLHRQPSDIALDPMLSAGLGVSCTFSKYMSASFDYGWRIRKIRAPEPGAGRGDIRISVTY